MLLQVPPRLKMRHLALIAAIAFLLASCAGTAGRMDPHLSPDMKLFESAERHFAAAEYERALFVYGQYLEQYPQTVMAPAAMLKSGMIHTETGNFQKARATYERLIEQFPGSDFALRAEMEMLFSYFREGRYGRVLEYAETLDEKRFPQGEAIHIRLVSGNALLAKGKYEAALDCFMETFSTAPASWRDYVGRRLAHAAVRMDPARIETVIGDLGGQPPAGYLLYGMGVGLAEDGRIGEAMTLMAGFPERFPGHELTDRALEQLSELRQIAWFEGHRIGVMLPLTGEYAAFGERALKGIKLAEAKYSEQNPLGPPMDVIVVDTGSRNGLAARGVKDLAGQNVAAIVGGMIGAEEIAREAETMGIPIVVLSQQPGVTEIGEYVFRNFLTPEMQAEALVQYAMNDLGLRQFGILYPEDTYGARFMEAFRDALARRNGILAGAEGYEPDSTHFYVPIQKLAKRYYDTHSNQYRTKVDMDAVFIPDSSKTAGLLIPQLRYYDINDVHLLGTNLWHSDQLIEIAGRELRNVVIPEGFYAQSHRRRVRDFTECFSRTYDESPGIIEATAYDSAMMLFELVGRPDIEDRITLKNELLRMPPFDGVTGETVFDRTGEAIKRLHLLEVAGRQFSELR